MKIILLDNNPVITKTWNLYFADEIDVSIVCEDFKVFMDSNKVDCVVSPGNAYGLMDGGYDLAISEWFDWKQQDIVQQYILRHFYGEQPVGTSFIIDTGKDNIKLIHTPTMRIPGPIVDPMVIYQCMRTTLITAFDNNVSTVVIPAFGGLCGNVKPQVICSLMYEAYKQVMNPPKQLGWEYIKRIKEV